MAEGIKSHKSVTNITGRCGFVMQTLVAYYSRTGNTRFVAEKIAEHLGAETCEVVDKKNRNGRFIILTGGYAALRNKLTDIEASKPIDNYDFIIIGSPVWAGKITPAIRTYITKNDFSDKKLACFVTMGGDKPEKPLGNIKEALQSHTPVATLGITDDLKNREEAEQQIMDWCQEIQKQMD
jgi:flavodoxin